MDNFFEDLNQNFFNVFTGKNRELNYELLVIINKLIGSSSQNYSTREDLIECITSYIKEHPQYKLYDDLNDEEILETDIRKFSSNKVSYFVRSGWLIEEEASNFKLHYSLDNNALEIIKKMEEITTSRKKTNELYGHVYIIYNMIKTFDITQSVGTCEQIVSHSDNLVTSLRGVNIIIKKYLTGLLQNKNLTPREILEKLLVEYNDKVVLKSLDNLRKRDNPENYKLFINENLDNIYNNHREELIKQYIEDKLNGDYSEVNKAIADSFFYDSFNKVKDVFNNINEIIQILNTNNAKYVASARARTAFLLNDNTNLEGLINDTLKNIKDVENDYSLLPEEPYFSLYSLGSISEDSLYSRRQTRNEVTDVLIEEISEISEEEVLEIQNNFFKDNLYSAYKINEYVLASLGSKDKIESKDLISENKEEDTIKQFLVLLYSANKNVDYKVDYDTKLDSFTRYDIEFNNFYIERI